MSDFTKQELQELANKKEALKLLGLPVKDRPEPENVFYTPSSRLEYARYRVVFNETVVCFQCANGLFIYLGELPLTNFPDLVAYYESELKIAKSEARIEEALSEPDLDTCSRCKTVMLTSDGEMTDQGFRCSNCLEVARKFETLTDAIRIVQAAMKKAYPLTNELAHSVNFRPTGNITISRHHRNDYGREELIGGFAEAEGLASDLLHRIAANKKRATEVKGLEVNWL